MCSDPKRSEISENKQQAEWPEKMKLSEASKFLGVSMSKMTNLVGSGRIAVEDDPLDRRVRLVKRSDLEELLLRRTHVK
jgi:Helix-turn-helix domain